ncbi:MAG TPA: adenosylmethionine--8-amino-7-oxononanoate transaminase [Myxococcota bacterium]|jgi:adenosylmethionine-8-amino-7-oxononanoate aminotransferase|nr:adenosylmethionine--8-amino-7-oxononanoate transaminase [Myxococcota bacterium]
MTAFTPEEAERLRAADRRHVWHPFTQMQEWTADPDDPLVIATADGFHLVDVDGRRYIDGVSSLWVNVHGHRHAALDAALTAQLGAVAHSTLLGLASVPSIRLAERLVALAPRGLSRVFYSDSGSTAVEIALKIAFQYWQQRGDPRRTRFLALRDAYHGDTLGSVSVGGMDLFHRIFRPLLFEALRAPPPYCYRCALGKTWPDCALACADDLCATLRAHAGEVAAVVVEPLVMGAAGMITAPAGWLARVRAACDETGALLICDEVATGFGRTGKMFACEHEAVAPDLLCVAKGLTGGYLPLAATLATERVYEAFLGAYADQRTFFHGHTYTGNALACAVALANLDTFERERTLERLAPKIALLHELLAPLRAHPHVGEVRQRGFMVGIELVADRATRAPYAYEDKMGAQVARAARRRGAILRPLGNVVVLMPPLAIDEETLRTLVAVARAGIDEVAGAAAPP